MPINDYYFWSISISFLSLLIAALTVVGYWRYSERILKSDAPILILTNVRLTYWTPEIIEGTLRGVESRYHNNEENFQRLLQDRIFQSDNIWIAGLIQNVGKRVACDFSLNMAIIDYDMTSPPILRPTITSANRLVPLLTYTLDVPIIDFSVNMKPLFLFILLKWQDKSMGNKKMEESFYLTCSCIFDFGGICNTKNATFKQRDEMILYLKEYKITL